MRHALLAISLAAALIAAPLANGGAANSSTSGGLTLLQAPGARASALGEAFTAATDDLSALGYNPASLPTLSQPQASFLYQRGITDDAYGQLMVGSPTKNGGAGLLLGYYNAGKIDGFDGVAQRMVTAQRDLALTLGYGWNAGPLNAGVSVKYLSSELAERSSAHAVAADAGVSARVARKVTLGAALQNFGTSLKFIDEADALPRIARFGTAIEFLPMPRATTLLLDLPYFFNERQWRPAAGIETVIGPLALRAGYQGGIALQGLSFGMGVHVGSLMLDYSFNFVDTLNPRHRIALSTRFGAPKRTSFLLSETKAPVPDEKPMAFEEGEARASFPRMWPLGGAQ